MTLHNNENTHTTDIIGVTGPSQFPKTLSSFSGCKAAASTPYFFTGPFIAGLQISMVLGSGVNGANYTNGIIHGFTGSNATNGTVPYLTIDTTQMLSTSFNTDILTVTPPTSNIIIKNSGYYQVYFSTGIQFNNIKTSVAWSFAINIYINGQETETGQIANVNWTDDITSVSVNSAYYLQPGDTISFQLLLINRSGTTIGTSSSQITILQGGWTNCYILQIA